MSLAWSERAWKHSRAKGSCLLVLLAVADNADEATGMAWPSIPYLARKVRLVERAVQYNLRRLVTLGELAIEEREGHSSRYRLTLPRGEAPFRGAKDAGVNVGAPGGASPCTGGDEPTCTGGVNVGAPRTVSEPSVGTVKEPKSARARATPLPADWKLTEERRHYAVGKGCRNPPRLCESFTAHYRGNGKTQADWDATWRQWVLGAHGGPEWKACGCGGSPPQRILAAGGVPMLTAAETAARGPRFPDLARRVAMVRP
jgi:hypothetical protein